MIGLQVPTEWHCSTADSENGTLKVYFTVRICVLANCLCQSEMAVLFLGCVRELDRKRVASVQGSIPSPKKERTIIRWLGEYLLENFKKLIRRWTKHQKEVLSKSQRAFFSTKTCMPRPITLSPRKSTQVPNPRVVSPLASVSQDILLLEFQPQFQNIFPSKSTRHT